MSRLGQIQEIAIDGFESFEWSQYFPFHHNVAVDVNTGYFLYHTDSPLRRKGRMTARQKARRSALEAILGRPDPRSVENGIRDLFEPFRGLPRLHTIRSDDHRAYPRALSRGSVRHVITSSRERRDRHNPLWEINLLDLLIRHSTAAHKRETIAWAKRRQASIEKLTIFQAWRNYMKRRHEKGTIATPAMQLGLAIRPWRLADLLAGRRFVEKTPLSPRWQDYYDRRVETPALGVNRLHTLRYAR